MISELRSVPDLMIRTWLKNLDLVRSGDPIERVEKHLEEGRLKAEQVRQFLEEIKNNGRKHIYLYDLPQESWKEIPNAKTLSERFEKYTKGTSKKEKLVFGMRLEQVQVQGERFLLRMGKVIQIPRIDKSVRITHNNREWAQIVYEDVSVNVVFEIHTSRKTVELRFDSISDMGAEKKKILHQAVQFMSQALALDGLSSSLLTKLPSQLEKSKTAAIFDLIAKVETENEDGGTITGTIRLSRDDRKKGSASELPGGRELLAGGNTDVLLDTFDVLWLADKSGDVLSRNIRTTVYSTTGEIHFRHHAFEAEMNYVLSNIRRAGSVLNFV